jgi:hypothetical protein
MTRRLSYANVMATIAVVLALGGTATAAVTLPRNSVGSKQIRNGQVRSGDIKNATVSGRDVTPGSLTGAHVADGSLGGADVADGSLGGADVNESSLGTVPNASTLGGTAATQFARSGGRVFSDRFTRGAGALQLGVLGFGTFSLECDNNNTPGLPADDRVRYSYNHLLGNDALHGMTATLADSVQAEGKTTIFAAHLPEDATIAGADRVAIDDYLRSRSGDRAIRISAWGFDDETSTTECTGMIEAQILR